MTTITKTTIRLALFAAAAAMISLLAGCGANEEILKSGTESPTPSSSTPTPIAEDLAAMKTANFTYVFVLRRKDGGPMDAEDRGIIRQNTNIANRRVSAEGEHAFVIGSNYAIDPKNMAALYDRFAVEDHSDVTTSPVPTKTSSANANLRK